MAPSGVGSTDKDATRPTVANGPVCTMCCPRRMFARRPDQPPVTTARQTAVLRNVFNSRRWEVVSSPAAALLPPCPKHTITGVRAGSWLSIDHLHHATNNGSIHLGQAVVKPWNHPASPASASKGVIKLLAQFWYQSVLWPEKK